MNLTVSMFLLLTLFVGKSAKVLMIAAISFSVFILLLALIQWGTGGDDDS